MSFFEKRKPAPTPTYSGWLQLDVLMNAQRRKGAY